MSEKVEEYVNLGCFNLGTLSETIAEQYMKTHMKNTSFMRGIYLMELLNFDSSGFFDVPPVPELFEAIHAEPIRAISRLPAMFLQSFTYQLKEIYDKSYNFAKAVNEFLKEDPTYHVLFAYSTFPAIYGFFCSNEMCQLGSEFVRCYIMEAKDEVISQALTSSFFCALPEFWNNFFSSFAMKTTNYTHSTSFNSFYIQFTRSLRESIPFLTSSHIQVLSVMLNTFPESTPCFFIEAIFYEHFLAYKDSSGYFTVPESVLAIQGFFDELKETKARDVLEIIFENSFRTRSFPSYAGTRWIKGVPIILCQRDIRCVQEILHSKKYFQLVIELDTKKFNDSILPLSVNIFPDFIQNKPNLNGIGKSLLGIEPAKVEIDERDDFSRIYAQVSSAAEEEGVDAITFINRNKSKAHSLQSKEFLDYALMKLNNQCVQNYQQLEYNIFAAVRCRNQEDFCNAIRDHMIILFHRFSFEFFETTIKQQNSNIPLINRIINAINIVTNKKEVSGDIVFAVFCTALDSIKLKQQLHCNEIDYQFRAILDKWMENNWMALNDDHLIKRKMLHILANATKISNIGEVGYGMKLHFIIDFINGIHIILGDSFNEYFYQTFIFMLFTSKETNILSSFLFLYHEFLATEIVMILDREIIECWSTFTNAIWRLISEFGNKTFIEGCMNRKYILG